MKPGFGGARRKRSVRVSAASTVALSAFLLAPAALADASKAESLFRDGRRLLADGQIAAACDKFAESQREEPSAGTLLNLAHCHAEVGMTASAWNEYVAAARLARFQGRPQQAAEAEERAAELEPRLMRLTIELAATIPGLVVTRNGEPLALAEVGKPIAVDPGRYVVRAVAPGYAEWTDSVFLAQPGQLRSVTIPALAPLAASPPATARVEDDARTRTTRPSHAATAATEAHASPPVARAESRHVPAAAWVLGGLGAAALASSLVLGVVAKSKWDDAHERGLCDASHSCNQQGIEETDRARRLGNVATGSAVFGVAALGSAFLFYALDTSSAPTMQVGVSLGRASAELGLRGGF